MKKIILVLSVLFLFTDSFAQNTIKFMGIPIDGSKNQMIRALVNKGFGYNSYRDELYGEFNGQNVSLEVQTIKNKVWRIAMTYCEDSDRNNLRITYNTLFNQFLSNKRYLLSYGNEINDYECISISDRYDAAFVLQDPLINGIVWFMIDDAERIFLFYENNDNAANGEDL